MTILEDTRGLLTSTEDEKANYFPNRMSNEIA